MGTKYIILETQTDADNNVAVLNFIYDDKQQAESKYHSVLQYAAVSTLKKHACTMLNEEGFMLKSECYEH